jgi:predicted esterase
MWLDQATKAAPATGGLERLIVLPTTRPHEATLIYLHGYQMEAKELFDLFLELHQLHPTWRFVLPQAPSMAVTALGAECRSWFNYLTDREGREEDVVEISSVKIQREALRQLLHSEAALLGGRCDRVFFGGLSQGGCMALDLACHMTFGGVVTLVAPRLGPVSLPLLCPWHALMGSEDEIFPPAWTKPLLAGATTVTVIKEKHWLPREAEIVFLRSALEKFERMLKTSDVELRL